MFDVGFLEDNVIQHFTSDFKILAKFFKNKRLGNPALADEDPITHVNAMMDFLRVFTNDIRYEEIKKNLLIKGREGAVTMCTVAQALEEKGIEKGIEQGKFIQLVELVNENILSVEKAAEFADIPVEMFLKKMDSK